MASGKRRLPTGERWRGCGAATAIGSCFLPGHDRAAETAVISVEYGGVPRFLVQLLVQNGYGPQGRNPQQETAGWRSAGKRGSKAR